MRNPVSKFITIAAAAAAVLGGGAFALAASASPAAKSTVIKACENNKTHVLSVQTRAHTCGRGYTSVKWNQTGPQGPSGVVSSSTTDLGGATSVPTGGGFVANATKVGTVSLPSAGTYLISLNAKATPNATTSGNVFPQFFVYDQAKNSSFTGDLFNVGSGALENPTSSELPNDVIDSYYSGSNQITLTSTTGATLYIYAFGYDSDTGAGSYTLDDLTVTATQITTS
jgi:hypothetical protein